MCTGATSRCPPAPASCSSSRSCSRRTRCVPAAKGRRPRVVHHPRLLSSHVRRTACRAMIAQDRLAEMITAEHGKTLPDAKGDVFRGLGAWPVGKYCAVPDIYHIVARDLRDVGACVRNAYTSDGRDAAVHRERHRSLQLPPPSRCLCRSVGIQLPGHGAALVRGLLSLSLPPLLCCES